MRFSYPYNVLSHKVMQPQTGPSPFNTSVQWENISISLMNNTSWLLSRLWAMIHYKHRVHGEGKMCTATNINCPASSAITDYDAIEAIW